MALEKCPHMTARCPHRETECDDPQSKECHHIKRTTASMIAAAAALDAVGVEALSPVTRKYLQETQDFLSETGISLQSGGFSPRL